MCDLLSLVRVNMQEETKFYKRNVIVHLPINALGFVVSSNKEIVLDHNLVDHSECFHGERHLMAQ